MADYIYEGRTKCGCFGAFVTAQPRVEADPEDRDFAVEEVMRMLDDGMIVQRLERKDLDLDNCAGRLGLAMLRARPLAQTRRQVTTGKTSMWQRCEKCLGRGWYRGIASTIRLDCQTCNGHGIVWITVHV